MPTVKFTSHLQRFFPDIREIEIGAERLMFGTSTGNLFVSDDRGETWNCISNYFPPIYSVLFI